MAAICNITFRDSVTRFSTTLIMAFRGLSGVTLTSALTGVQTLAAGEPLHRKQRS